MTRLALVLVLSWTVFGGSVQDDADILWKLESNLVLDAKTHGPSVSADMLPEWLDTFSVVAWVKPAAFDRYNEIFRVESGTGRFLFSFQESGTILSLGLHGDRYMECDGPIDPKKVADGRWHCVAGTFADGLMRVWLDGVQLFSAPLPGNRAQVARGVQGWVGSSSGMSEFFRGEIGELRILRKALTPREMVDEVMAKAGVYGKVFDMEGLRARIVERIGELNMERPLTDEQWTRAGAQDRELWKNVDAFVAAAFPRGVEKATLEELLAAQNLAWPKLPLRPRERESVAPYRAPVTPEPRRLGAESARLAIEADWLYQATDGADPVDELARTEKLAKRLGMKAEFSPELRAFAAAAKCPEEKMSAYLAVRRVKRALMFANPAVATIRKLLILDAPYPQGSEWRHETRHRLGYMGVPGGQLLALDGLRPDGAVTRLAPHAPFTGSFWRPDVSYDGKKILFCFRPHNEKTFHLYEMDADGSNCRQLTSGIFDDLDPIYLPDGKHYVFTSTRGYTYVRCMPPTNAFSLMRGTFGSDDLYFISSNNEPDYLPSVAGDGRILYTRWEYTDKPLWRAQSLWTVNPDGTQANTFWGNQSVWPDVLKDARQIPGSRRVMFTGSAHHNWFNGCIGIVDPAAGDNFPKGLTKVTREQCWPESGNGPVDPGESAAYKPYGKWEAYISPWPLNEHDFLVAARKDQKFVLYLMDTDGNRELVYEGENNILHFMPLQARPKPPVVADRVTLPTRAERLAPVDGSIYSADVHEGVPEKMKGKIKYLRVWYLEQKTYTYWSRRPALSTGPVVSGVQTDGVKRYLGEVPVQDDGSVWFSAPSGLALHFQALDENHRALQTMRSFVSVQPGESRGCVGCHERTSASQSAPAAPRGKAFSRPERIRPAPWDKPGNRLGVAIGYKRDIVPILARRCGACHLGEGKGRRTFDLTEKGWLPYMQLVGWPGWASKDRFPGMWASVVKEGWPTIDPAKPPAEFDLAGTLKVENFGTTDPKAYRTFEPMTRLSYNSRLVKMLSGEMPHQGVKATDEEIFKTVLWVDAICPFLTDADIRAEEDPVFQGVDWLSQKPRLKTAPTPVRPGPFSAHADVETVSREYW